MLEATRIGFSYSKGIGGWLSRVIMTVSDAPASHAWLLYRSIDFGMDMVMEASEFGFRVVPYQTFIETSNVVRVWTPRAPIDTGAVRLAQHLGCGYDFGGLLGMADVVFGERLWGRRLRNPWQSKKALFCTEAVAMALRFTKYPGTERWRPSRVSPRHIWTLLENDGSVEWRT